MDFIIGGVSAMCAGVFTNPFDVIKTRQQLQGELIKRSELKFQPYTGLTQAIKAIVKADGILGLQRGFGPAISFQFVLNSTRLGLYETGDKYGWLNNRKGEHSTVLCVGWGAVCGVAGASIGCPLYMIKTQLQSQSVGKFAVGHQHKHKGTWDGLKNIVKSRGFAGLWHGYTGIVPRTAVGSAVQMSTFTSCKDILLKHELFKQSVFLTALGASLVAGFWTCVFMTPFDVVATRMFNQGTDANGKGLLYKNIFQCFYKTFKIEGVRGLYKGFAANYSRAAPHTMLNLTFWDQLKKLRNIYVDDKLK